jgi:glycosyltransferase involved in cell wall biosynthesis
LKPLKITELTFLDDKYFPNLLPREHEAHSVDTWAGLIARRLIKYKPSLDIEAWRTRKDFNNVKEKEVFGIKGIIFPYRKPIIKNILTYEMLRRLLDLRKEYFVILHYHNLFDLRFIFFTVFLPRDIKIVLSHHGGTPPAERKFKSFLIKMFLKNKYISHITYISPEARDFIRRIKNHPQLSFMPMGANYELHQPADKIEARKKLGLDKDKIYGIYVGSFYRLKSIDLILDFYNKLKDKYNFSVIFVGGESNSDNDLYKEVAGSGCPYFGIMKVNEMTDFYNAADFYIHPAFNPDFGGIDVSWMEALACNIPVVSPKLSYLDFDYSELGLCPADYDDFFRNLIFMIENYHKYNKCREISKKYLDGNTSIIEKLYSIYTSIYNGHLNNSS